MRILVDMDGVIANWGLQYDRELERCGPDAAGIPRTTEQRSFDLNAGRTEKERTIIAAIMAQPGFYAQLQPMPGALAALKSLVDAGHDVEIVSSNWPDNPTCADDKIQWVRDHLGPEWVRRVTLTHDKAAVRGDILIDDRPDIPGAEHAEWVQVLFDQPYNQHVDALRIPSWEDETRFEPSPWRAVVRQALTLAKNRNLPGEPLIPSEEWLRFVNPAAGTTVDASALMGEVRKVSTTGGEKGSKPQRYDLIPVLPMDKLAELYGRGAAKYAAHNWRRGYDWSLSYAAAMRHLTRFWEGEDLDPEMGLPHPIAAVFHCFALVQFMEDFPQFDDRFGKRPIGELRVEGDALTLEESEGLKQRFLATVADQGAVPPFVPITPEDVERFYRKRSWLDRLGDWWEGMLDGVRA